MTVALCIGFCISFAYHTAAQPNTSGNPADWNSANFFSPTNVIYNNYPPTPQRSVPQPNRLGIAGSHSIRATNQIPEEALRLYLESKHSPLAPFSAQLLESPYWSTIIGITYVEQSFSKLPGGTNWNLFGIMGCNGLCFYGNGETAINAINNFLEKHEVQHPTIESFRGWYCVNRAYPGNICPNWEQGVLKVKLEIESLESSQS